jgi:NAD(P)-dependent dehydrogenase (short-subunit alcohol dehydrogenase family)
MTDQSTPGAGRASLTADPARSAFVTGGTRGIGLAVTRRLARGGYRVTACGASADGVEACRAAARDGGLDITVVQIDVTDDDLLARGIAEAASRQGGLDVLVCCAGRPVLGDALTLSLADWDQCLDLNLRASFAAVKAALPHMVGRGGAIVLVSSIWDRTATFDRTAYVTAKTALSGLARALAVDHAKSNIRVNCVAPGYVETDLLRKSLARVARDVDAELDRIRRAHPLGRLVSADDIANAVAFLSGEEARNITGQTLCVDGGVTVRLSLPTE